MVEEHRTEPVGIDLERRMAEEHMAARLRMALVVGRMVHLDLRTMAAGMVARRRLVDLGRMALERIHNRQPAEEHHIVLVVERKGSLPIMRN